ncbi:MAG: phage holin family protein [Oscillospiraceae bacterium]|nr:phage holin family protein [Oscillospiraceae bacterium]
MDAIFDDVEAAKGESENDQGAELKEDGTDAFLKSCVRLLGGLAGFLFGEMDGLMIALITFIVLDYITGCIVGAVKHRLNSAISFKGLAKKALIFVIVAVAHIIDTQVLGGSASVFRSAACGLYIANEGMSILENSGKLGLPLPKKLKNVLEQLHDKSDNEKGD